MCFFIQKRGAFVNTVTSAGFCSGVVVGVTPTGQRLRTRLLPARPHHGWGHSASPRLVGNLLLLGAIVLFLVAGWRRGIDVYATFVEGAKQGFETAVGLIPYLVAMLVAIAVFRASGALDAMLSSVGMLLGWLGLDTAFVPALPTAIMKSLSGSGARAMMLETFQHYGVDSFPALVAAILQGSSETTFYVLAVYFGAVGIRRERHALACGLFADLVAVVVAILVAYWFFR
jgi:spore maturation protein SpmB